MSPSGTRHLMWQKRTRVPTRQFSMEVFTQLRFEPFTVESEVKWMTALTQYGKNYILFPSVWIIAAISHHTVKSHFRIYHYDIVYTTKIFFQPEIPTFLIKSIRNPNYYAGSVWNHSQKARADAEHLTILYIHSQYAVCVLSFKKYWLHIFQLSTCICSH